MPITNTLMTNPRITWSIENLIAKIAKIKEISAPAIGATIKPQVVFWVRLATTPAANAPASNWPSIAILITPDRSQSTPAIAPKISGTESKSPPRNSPVNGIIFPLAAQHKNDINIEKPPKALTN